jgi:maleylpyruvate isomerase
MKRTDRTITVPWMVSGTTFVLDRLGRLDDDGFAAASALPGWRNAHVAAHLARNAEAMRRLVTWAATGMPTPAYASPEQRDADIEQSAQQTPEQLRADIRTTASALSTAIAVCPDMAWASWIEGASGRRLQAVEVPWLRTREVYLHSLDVIVPGKPPLGMADLPAEMIAELLDDVAGSFTRRGELPAMILTDSATGRMWAIGSGGPPVLISGPTAELVSWLVGRTDGSALTTNAALPALPPWL